MIGAEYIPVLAVAASLAVPYLTEAAKRRFGRPEAAEAASHRAHDELISELRECRAELSRVSGEREVAEAAESRCQEQCRELARREIALLRDVAGKDILLAQLSGSLPELTGGQRRN